MWFFFLLPSGAGVVCSSDWGCLGGCVLIIWILWSNQRDRFSNKQHLILNIHQSLEDYLFSKDHSFSNKCLFFLFRDEPRHHERPHLNLASSHDAQWWGKKKKTEKIHPFGKVGCCSCTPSAGCEMLIWSAVVAAVTTEPGMSWFPGTCGEVHGWGGTGIKLSERADLCQKPISPHIVKRNSFKKKDGARRLSGTSAKTNSVSCPIINIF